MNKHIYVKIIKREKLKVLQTNFYVEKYIMNFSMYKNNNKNALIKLTHYFFVYYPPSFLFGVIFSRFLVTWSLK